MEVTRWPYGGLGGVLMEGKTRDGSNLPQGCRVVDGGEVCRGERRGIRRFICIYFWKEDIFPQTLSPLMAKSRSYSLAPGL